VCCSVLIAVFILISLFYVKYLSYFVFPYAPVNFDVLISPPLFSRSFSLFSILILSFPP
jgi:hypothetical protein